ncbi:hypothetical protein [Bradyrhizobium sp. CCBAU 53415]|uniref:hypothetical protein n=1 Tax=Bradyrhizobium sp. CCBAU 53415 TaxID=1325119 RepID=UPI0023063698|nr:hypothetical protein [Bradyrhizobium sp. CCBAU 53415]MDA9463051.1 hypothetical protein [Bradyrhizobium sp. CCBAU 53415]
MQIKGILLSHAIRFFAEAADPIAERRSPIPLIRGLQDMYGFVQVPTTVAELDFTKGVTFLQGYYKGAVISKFQIYENGMLCEALADNSTCDEFMGEVLKWATTEHNIPVKENGVKAFLSQLEIASNANLEKHLQKIDSVAALIGQSLQSYGQPVALYQISGIKLHYDSAALPVPRPPEFVFERRAGQPYSANEYFSSAPLRTADHMRVLDQLEKIF